MMSPAATTAAAIRFVGILASLSIFAPASYMLSGKQQEASTMAEETCPKCGAVYDVTYVKVIFRDKDSYDCGCGHELASWNGSSIPHYRMIKPGKEKDAKRP